MSSINSELECRSDAWSCSSHTCLTVAQLVSAAGLPERACGSRAEGMSKWFPTPQLEATQALLEQCGSLLRAGSGDT